MEDFDIMNCSAKELNATDAQVVMWPCCVSNCNGFTKGKNFEILPFIWWRNKWIDLTSNVLLCAKHMRLYRAYKKAGGDGWPKWHYRPGQSIQYIKLKPFNPCSH